MSEDLAVPDHNVTKALVHLLNRFVNLEHAIMTALADLQANIQANSAIIQTAVAKITANKQQIADLLAQNAALTQQVADLQAEVNDSQALSDMSTTVAADDTSLSAALA